MRQQPLFQITRWLTLALSLVLSVAVQAIGPDFRTAPLDRTQMNSLPWGMTAANLLLHQHGGHVGPPIGFPVERPLPPGYQDFTRQVGPIRWIDHQFPPSYFGAVTAGRPVDAREFVWDMGIDEASPAFQAATSIEGWYAPSSSAASSR